jgi:hypothetical protein
MVVEGNSDMAAPSPLPLDGSVVKMKGLPFKASSEDVLKFYGGFGIKSNNIYLKRHPDGRPSGEVRGAAVAARTARHTRHADLVVALTRALHQNNAYN